MARNAQETQKTTTNNAHTATAGSWIKRRWPRIAAIGFLLLAAAGAYWWFFMRGRISTDDAYVKADSASISSRIDGTVAKVLVDNDQLGEEGQVLVELDKKDYQVAVHRAEAVLNRITAEIAAAKITVALTDAQTQAQLESAEANLQKTKEQEQEKYHQMEQLKKQRLAFVADLTYTEKEFHRYEHLYRRNAVSEQQRDNAKTSFEKAQAALKAQDAAIEAIKASLKALQQQVDQAKANLKVALSDREQVSIQRYNLVSLMAQQKQAQAELEQARLNLSYCTIKAPIAGHIGQKNVQVGDRIKTGQSIMAVVPLHAVYAEANFKETELEHVKLGQTATVAADIYPGFTYHGKVVGIGAGTGAAFSLLPPENATGNWIKIVQRVPVKIEFDPPPPADYPLRVGLSLHVTIHFRDQ
jgi:membrane fusion protein (multidrug efflux system)